MYDLMNLSYNSSQADIIKIGTGAFKHVKKRINLIDYVAQCSWLYRYTFQPIIWATSAA